MAKRSASLHDTHGLAVALGPGAAEIVLQPRLGVVALLQPQHRDRLAAEAREAGHQRLVLGEGAVAGQRREVGEQRPHVIEAVRPVGMARHLHLLPRRQLAVDVAQRLLRTLLQPGDLVGDVDGLAALRQLLQLQDLAFEVGDRLFEIEIIEHPP